MQAIIRGLALEVHEKKGDKEGVVFNNLIVYEFGQRYPDIRRISLKQDQVLFAKSLCAKMVEVTVDVSSYQGRTSMYLQEAVEAKKAA